MSDKPTRRQQLIGQLRRALNHLESPAYRHDEIEIFVGDHELVFDADYLNQEVEY